MTGTMPMFMQLYQDSLVAIVWGVWVDGDLSVGNLHFADNESIIVSPNLRYNVYDRRWRYSCIASNACSALSQKPDVLVLTRCDECSYKYIIYNRMSSM